MISHQYLLKLFCCFAFTFCSCFCSLMSQDVDSNSQKVVITRAKYDYNVFWEHFHYPETAKKANLEGPTVLSVSIDSLGKITNHKFIISLGPLFENAVNEALGHTSFTPPKRNGIPYATTVNLPFKFFIHNFTQEIKYNYHEQIIFALGVLMKIDEKNRSEYLYLRGKEHFKEREYEYANDDYNEYTSLLKENQKLFYEDDILNSIASILPKDTINVDSLTERGQVFLDNNLYDNSLAVLNQVLQKNTSDSAALLCRAQLYNAIKEYDKSIIDYMRLIPMHSYSTMPYVNIGWNYYMLGDMDKCIEFSEKAIEMDRYQFTARFNRAIAYLRLGNIEKAKMLYKQTNDMVKDGFYSNVNGAIEDLKDLIHDKIMVEESKEILNDIFKVSADNLARCW